MKVSETSKDPSPRRAFRLQDCTVLEKMAAEGGSSFEIRGMNCSQTYIMDRRATWEFMGTEAEVKVLLRAISLYTPVITYSRKQYI